VADLTSKLLVVISASTGGAARELQQLEAGARRSGTAFDTVGKQAGLAGATIRAGLVAGAAALVGTGLVAFLGQSATAFAESAKAAGELAKSTGGSVETVSRLQAALKGAGIGAEQSAGLMTKFTTNAGRNKGLLDELGVTLQRNKDGTVDYASTLVQAVDKINLIGDSSKRNQALVALFGKQGAAAFNELASSGISLSESMRLVNKYQVFTAADVASAKAYDDAMDGLGASVQGLQFALGRDLVPAISAITNAGTAMLGVLMSIPAPVYLAVGAFLALRKASEFELGAKAVGLFLGSLDNLDARLAGTAGNLTSIKGAATLAGSGLKALAVSSAPLLALTAVFALASDAMTYAKSLRELSTSAGAAGTSLADLAAQGVKTDSVVSTVLNFGDGGYAQRRKVEDLTQSYRDQAKAVLTAADSTDAQRAAAQRLLDASEGMTIQQKAANLATKDGEAARRDFIAATEGMAGADALAAQATTDLGDTVAKFLGSAASATPQELADGLTGIADAAIAANEATLEQQQATNLAEIAAGQYAVSIQGVVEWQSKLAENTANTESALGGLQDTLTQVGNIVDNPDTWQNEVVLNTANATDDLWKYVGLLADSGLTTDKIIPLLLDLQNRDGTSADADALIGTIISALQDKTNAVPVDISTRLDPTTAASTQTGIDGLTVPKTVPLTVNTSFAPGGFDAVKANVDSLAQARSGSVSINTAMNPSFDTVKGQVLDLAQNRQGLITMHSAFEPGGYAAIKDRTDYLSQNRTATITVRVAGLDAARRAVDSVQPHSAEFLPGRIMLPSVAQPAAHPVNLVRVTLDGQQLRAIIRDEASRYAPVGQEVA
jgi:hypothetical protein